MTQHIEVDVDVRTGLPSTADIDESFYQRIFQASAEILDVSGEVSVSLVSDDEIQELNRIYRNLDRPTDVLSFALREGNPLPGPIAEELELLGDIVVSVPTAMRQSTDYGHSLARELAFLLVHGLLHLLGYDHETEADEAEMTQLQETVLGRVGLHRPSSENA